MRGPATDQGACSRCHARSFGASRTRWSSIAVIPRRREFTRAKAAGSFHARSRPPASWPGRAASVPRASPRRPARTALIPGRRETAPEVRRQLPGPASPMCGRSPASRGPNPGRRDMTPEAPVGARGKVRRRFSGPVAPVCGTIAYFARAPSPVQYLAPLRKVPCRSVGGGPRGRSATRSGMQSTPACAAAARRERGGDGEVTAGRYVWSCTTVHPADPRPPRRIRREGVRLHVHRPGRGVPSSASLGAAGHAAAGLPAGGRRGGGSDNQRRIESMQRRS